MTFLRASRRITRTTGNHQLKVNVEREFHFRQRRHDTCSLVISDALLEEVGFTSDRDVVHEIERALAIEDLQEKKSKIIASGRK